MMHVDLFILIITCITNVLLGLIVMSRDAKRLYARSFAAMSVFICIWIVANFITNHFIDDLVITNIANRVTYAAGFASVVAGMVFSYSFPYMRKISRAEAGTVGTITSIIIFLSLFTDSISGKVILDQSGRLSYPIGDLLWLFIIGFLVILILMARNLLSVPKEQGEKKRQQARYIFLALVISAFMALVINVVIPLLTGDWGVSRFGPLTMILLVGTIAYTIVKHGLFDIRLAVVRGIAYFLSLLTLAGIYYGVAFTVSEFILHRQAASLFSLSPLSVGLALLLAFIFQPLKNFFDKYTNRIFYRDNYSVDDFFAR
ncbi:MAG TPA: hypothetical protein VFT59_05790, partial [Candidatus Saccharimonadales bacterium]|nr:hypothetical protein [Candidatus Saccharimonadales bacterium]